MVRYLTHFLLRVREGVVTERVQKWKKANQIELIGYLAKRSVSYRK